MKNAIRKISSLCFAMMMVLSVMAAPALAEERAVLTSVSVPNFAISRT